MPKDICGLEVSNRCVANECQESPESPGRAMVPKSARGRWTEDGKKDRSSDQGMMLVMSRLFLNEEVGSIVYECYMNVNIKILYI